MSKLDDFCVFILSHQRSEKIYTLESLKEMKCPEEIIYIVVDDEDPELEDYKIKYNNVLIFNKDEMKEKLSIDMMDNFNNYCNCVIPRNTCFELAKQLGVKYFIQLDDDYTSFRFRYVENGALKSQKIFDIKPIFEIFLEFFDESGADSVCFGQGGDFIGGVGSHLFKKKCIRKCMNGIFNRTDKIYPFKGTMNDDVTVYTNLAHKGKLFLTTFHVSIYPLQSQKNSGGLTDIYLDEGTYVKSFYSVIATPSSVKLSTIVDHAAIKPRPRFHHMVLWNNCTPKILNERYKK